MAREAYPALSGEDRRGLTARQALPGDPGQKEGGDSEKKGGQLYARQAAAQKQRQDRAEAGAGSDPQGIRGGQGIGKKPLKGAAGDRKSRAHKARQDQAGHAHGPDDVPDLRGNGAAGAGPRKDGAQHFPRGDRHPADPEAHEEAQDRQRDQQDPQGRIQF